MASLGTIPAAAQCVSIGGQKWFTKNDPAAGEKLCEGDDEKDEEETEKRSTAELVARAEASGVSQSELMWLARTIYLETDRLHEMEKVGWVIRNRVETQYLGDETYNGVVLKPYQFEPYNKGIPQRVKNFTLRSSDKRWQQAIRVAEKVASAPRRERPFPKTTRHFYSPRSMDEDVSNWPLWTRYPERFGCERVYVENVLDRRFRFFKECF